VNCHLSEALRLDIGHNQVAGELSFAMDSIWPAVPVRHRR
jgi:hypothetical protein